MQLKNISDTTPFSLTQGGRYLATFRCASWSSGTAVISRKSADGTAYVPVAVPDQWTNVSGTLVNPQTTAAADQTMLMDLPAGDYEVTLSGLTGLYLELAWLGHG
jgi:hypothetical protein